MHLSTFRCTFIVAADAQQRLNNLAVAALAARNSRIAGPRMQQIKAKCHRQFVQDLPSFGKGELQGYGRLAKPSA